MAEWSVINVQKIISIYILLKNIYQLPNIDMSFQ